jgi:hypothetical protein
MPSPIVETRVVYAAAGSKLGSLNCSLRTIMAQAMRAILLASATAATLTGRRSMICASQSRRVPRCRAYRITAMAPATSSHRKYRFPCFEILPDVPCRRSNAAWEQARSRPRGFARTRTLPNHPLPRLGRWRRSDQRRGSVRAVGFLRTNDARHGCASR